ncbi:MULTISPECIES: hypothetical protein [unclassified Sphingobium]|uniref:hypothetical protein n=1 Tax=unclassified Sphingobium TaxID=2611147 RepID=UPI0011A08A44|nr:MULTISPECIES: hypothetical protein [unclassified Sphingobium]
MHVHVHSPDKKNSLYDAGVYLPALPGMLVALFGLWAAHALAQRRDRKKAIADLCEALKKIAAEASAAAIDAWIESDPAKRASGVASTKRLLQSAGITATTLKRRTNARWSWGLSAPLSFYPLRIFERRSINLLRPVSALRQAAMADPFEDPSRGTDISRADAINAAVSSLIASTDRALFDYQG